MKICSNEYREGNFFGKIAIKKITCFQSTEISQGGDRMEKESRYEDFIRYSAEGIFLIEYFPPIPTMLSPEEQYRLSVQRGVITECNDAIAHMYGFKSREEMLGKPYLDFYTEEGIEDNLEVNLAFIQNGYRLTDIETEEFDISGNKVYFLNNVVGIIKDGYFTGSWGTQRDVTKLKEAEQKIIEAYDKTLEGWAKALELRDHETENHSRRVTERTIELAKKIGVADEELEHIRRGAILHDIGKMGIPDEILHKPGPLTQEERCIIEKHPEYAYKLLAEIPFLHKALEIPYCHHERWDGNGYPQGLAGEAIPVAARIFAVVDVWDAICSERPYKKAWTREQATAFIKEKSGKYFDPGIVDAFLPLVRDV